jgi:hypothetical protein
MNEFMLKPARRVDCALLCQRLTELHVPFRDASKENLRLIRLGTYGEFDVATAVGWGNKVSKASITIRYDHPALKDILIRWLEECDVSVHEDFFKGQFGLPPAVIESTREKWRLDLSELPVTPVCLSKIVSAFMFGENVSANIAGQLTGVPQKRWGNGDFIKCAEWEIAGEGAADVVYKWTGQHGAQFAITVWSAPVVTTLSLWEIPEGAEVEINIGEI